MSVQSVCIADYSGTPQQALGQFVATKFAAATLNSTDGTNPETMLTAPADKYIFITGIQITIDPTATIGSAGMVNIIVSDSVSGNLATLRAYIPATPAAPTVPTVVRETSSPGAFWAATTKGSSITAQVSVALTNASVRVSFHYGLTSHLIGNN